MSTATTDTTGLPPQQAPLMAPEGNGDLTPGPEDAGPEDGQPEEFSTSQPQLDQPEEKAGPARRSWQALCREDLDEEDRPYLRMSSAAKCHRALAYAAQRTPESDPPGPQARNRMALGHMAEILIIRDLEERGWETDHTVLSENGQLELKLSLPESGVVLTGHPDGICRHERFTREQWVPLECKSMGPDRGEETEAKGIAKTYPGYMAQIALYGRELHALGLTQYPQHGVFAVMDREGRPLPPERVSWTPEFTQALTEKMDQAAIHGENSELPERPYKQSSQECKYCNYHTECWGEVLKTQPGVRRPQVLSQEPDVISAATEWAKLKPRVEEAKDVLQAASNKAGQADVIAGGITAGYFQPRSEPVYDHSMLTREVPADVLRKCTIPQEPKKLAFWVRTTERK